MAIDFDFMLASSDPVAGQCEALAPPLWTYDNGDRVQCCVEKGHDKDRESRHAGNGWTWEGDHR